MIDEVNSLKARIDQLTEQVEHLYKEIRYLYDHGMIAALDSEQAAFSQQVEHELEDHYHIHAWEGEGGSCG